MRISAVIDPMPVMTLPRGMAREDIGAVFPALAGRSDSAFAGEIPLPPGFAAPFLLKIFAELDTGESHLAFGRRFIPRHHGSTGELPPLVSGLTFCRAVWELQRAAGRYGLSRHGLIPAAQKAWAAYAAQPAYRPRKKFRPAKSPPAANAGTENPSIGGLPVCPDIAPGDDMYVSDAAQYFHLGRETLLLLQAAVARADCKRVDTILDLPCGYGRIARWFRVAYPQAKLTVSDTQAPAVAFCVEHFGATGVLATEDGRHWAELLTPYDLIWCGSLLTHFDRTQWVTHLRRFSERLTPQGVLVFTTHGLISLDWLLTGEKDYGLPEARIAQLRGTATAEGFGYIDYPDTSGYGISVAEPGWVLDLIDRETDLRVLDLRVAGWDGHQDVFVCVRRPPAKPKT